jgi:hypothetical protein
VADLKFSQSASRNYATPILLALVILGAAFALYAHLQPVRTIDITVPHLSVFTAHTIFKSDGPANIKDITVIRDAKYQDDLYVIATLDLQNNLKFPAFIKDITATFTTPEGELLTSSAVEKNDLPNLYVSFPDLKKMATTPLLRETTIPPGQSAEGMVIFHFSGGQAAWDERKAASVSIDFYHQPSQTVSFDTQHPPLVKP